MCYDLLDLSYNGILDYLYAFLKQSSDEPSYTYIFVHLPDYFLRINS